MESLSPAVPVVQARLPKSLVLCFDGTGNKFQGNASDSNIVKIFSLLDRQDANQFHYYQPGIGTYVEASNLSRKSTIGNIRSAYVKAMDMAIGSSFGEHVMAGYKFLMRYYQTGDHIYFFGFSRGAYTARFLAQMVSASARYLGVVMAEFFKKQLDYVGLLAAGNEEMLRFAWKTFADWLMRSENTRKSRAKKREQFHFIKRFRETYSRPIDRIRFLGLLDCVNSVPQFESAWMRRTKFPYTAKTSALVIRHAVSIDERRAKFRQDLISQQRSVAHEHAHLQHDHHHWHHHQPGEPQEELPGPPPLDEGPSEDSPTTKNHFRFRPKKNSQLLRPMASGTSSINGDAASSTMSFDSGTPAAERRMELKQDEDASVPNEDHQDILEIWFAGQHGDIGGGWQIGPYEERPASDLPLIWMIREARNAGMPLDEDKLDTSGLLVHDFRRQSMAPTLLLDGQDLPRSGSKHTVDLPRLRSEADLLRLETETKLHDSLAFGRGMSWPSCLAWKLMEYMPFRRMDLQKDGTWKPIIWPLPMGEVRDMPDDALIHASVIRRMQADKTYRPGNVIIGGGGRGVRKAPAQAGIGQWRVAHGEGDRVGEAVVREHTQQNVRRC